MLHGQTRYGISSRFFNEVPQELLQWLSSQAIERKGSGTDPLRSAELREAAREHARARGGLLPATHGFRIGQSVSHAKFGVGIIVNAEGNGRDARLQVNFHEAGLKWLALEFARLSPA
jgi:DNA helicase-2/ATP-dependent DNA helicase PcrA